jgi:adenosylcobinamide-GDP ribazoletransferase
MAQSSGNDKKMSSSGRLWWHQWCSVWAFLTRLPSPAHRAQPLGQAAWAMPVVGLILGTLGAGVLAGADALGLGALVSAALGVAATVWASGALHEDGLADFADAFGLPRSAERTHEILKDPRMGAFGMVTLSLSLLLRVALAAEAGPLALIAAEMLSRASIMATMAWSEPAGKGQAAAAGKASGRSTAGVILLALAVGFGLAGPGIVWGAGLALVASAMVLQASNARIDGYTGDVLGAVQQVSVIALLLGSALGT